MLATLTAPPRATTNAVDAARRLEFVPEHQRGRLGPVTVPQIVVIELAATAIAIVLAATKAQNVALLGVVLFVANLLVIAVFVRSGGAWWYQQRLVRRRLRQRRRAAKATVRATGSPLAALVPGLVVRTVYDRGSRIGVGQDSAGWYAVLETMVPQTLRGERADALAFEKLARIFTESTVPVSALQVVSHTVPAPTGLLDPRAPCRQGYAELLAGETVPAYQALWVAVRLNPADAAAAAASRGGGLAGVDRALAAAVGRIGKALTAADVEYRVLDAEGLLAALVTACAPGAEAYEHWTAWQTGDSAHTCLRLSRWPRQSPAALFETLAAVPAQAVSVAVILQPNAERIAARVLVRVVTQPDALRSTIADLTAVAKRAGARLDRADGEHGLGVYAVAPTGGGEL
jgi:type VII secretion protein EccE